MEPLRGSRVDLIADSMTDEIPPGFILNPDHSLTEPRSGSINNRMLKWNVVRTPEGFHQ
jgi:hypothetical protein